MTRRHPTVALVVGCLAIASVACRSPGIGGDRARGDVQPVAPQLVRLSTRDGGVIQAHLYGSGERGVVLAHGGRFNKESWARQARHLAEAGFHVLAIDFRGYGGSTGPGQADVFTAPLHLDVLAAVHDLRARGAKTVSAVGGSLGGSAVASAAIAEPGPIDRIVLLGSTPDAPPEGLTIPKLYIATRDDANAAGPRLPGLQAHFDKAPPPKELILYDGSAHAQFIFQTEYASSAMREIVVFLSSPTPRPDAGRDRAARP
jgi:pimeloyl-ACP methyl ester carboxylesterase